MELHHREPLLGHNITCYFSMSNKKDIKLLYVDVAGISQYTMMELEGEASAWDGSVIVYNNYNVL